MQSVERKIRNPTSNATPGGFQTKDAPAMFASKISTNYKPFFDFLESFEWKYPASDPEQQFLDIGCGTGDVTREHILPRCPPCRRLLAVDYSKEMIEYAREHFGHPKIEYRQMNIGLDVGDFLAENGTFQRVYSLRVLHLVEDQALALANISRLMTPGGECLLFFFARSEQFEFCRRMAKLPRWTKYSEVFERAVPRTHDIMDAAELKSYMTNLVSSAGLVIIKIALMEREGAPLDAETIVDTFLLTNPLLPILGEEEREAFIEDARKYGPAWRSEYEETNPLPSVVFAVHASKP